MKDFFFLFVFTQKKSSVLQKNGRRGKIFIIVIFPSSPPLNLLENSAAHRRWERMQSEPAAWRGGKRRARLKFILRHSPALHLMLISYS